MENSQEALGLILDSITDHIVVINETGDIQYTNKSWSMFGANNACTISADWVGVNYLDECDRASLLGDEFGVKAGVGIRSVISKQESIFYFEYPCHSPDEQRWFMMRVTPLEIAQNDYFVISHQNITERRLAEDEVRKLAGLDGLVNIPNRRSFNKFLHDEWIRCARQKKSISMAMVDLDHFKLLNDTYGHQVGDDCLIKIGKVLKKFANRPSDICARYGGEEFVLVWGDTPLEDAKQLTTTLLQEINALKINNINSPIESYLTASVGLAAMIPSKGSHESKLVGKADSMLYRAKESGRNRVES